MARRATKRAWRPALLNRRLRQSPHQAGLETRAPTQGAPVPIAPGRTELAVPLDQHFRRTLREVAAYRPDLIGAGNRGYPEEHVRLRPGGRAGRVGVGARDDVPGRPIPV